MYSFGVLLYEMVAGRRAWPNMLASQIMLAVTLRGQKLQFPGSCMPELAECASCPILRQAPLFANSAPALRLITPEWPSAPRWMPWSPRDSYVPADRGSLLQAWQRMHGLRPGEAADL